MSTEADMVSKGLRKIKDFSTGIMTMEEHLKHEFVDVESFLTHVKISLDLEPSEKHTMRTKLQQLIAWMDKHQESLATTKAKVSEARNLLIEMEDFGARHPHGVPPDVLYVRNPYNTTACNLPVTSPTDAVVQAQMAFPRQVVNNDMYWESHERL